MKKLFSVVVLGMLFFTGCGGGSSSGGDGGSGGDQHKKETGVQGKVLNLAGEVIKGVSVTVNDKVAQTDSNGLYKIKNVTPANRVIINVKHSEYMQNSRVVEVKSEVITTQNFKLSKPQIVKKFNPLAGISWPNIGNGPRVLLPANSYVDSAGNDFTGEVTLKMSYFPITTLDGRESFPGTFEGIEGNSIVPIKSYGFMDVTLSDSSNNKINLKNGSTAKLYFPVDPNLDSPASIPLWYYDDKKGYWIKNGLATLKNGKYEGDVTHFTTWNLDAKGPIANVNGCVEDENGTKVEGAYVGFYGVNWSGFNGPTPSDGTFSFIRVLAETRLILYAYGVNSQSMDYFGEYKEPLYLIDGSTKNLDECIVVKSVDVNGSQILTIKGKLVHVDNNEALANQPLYITYYEVVNGVLVYKRVNFLTNSDATFSIKHNFGKSLILQLSSINYFLYKTILLNINQNQYDLGIVTAEEYPPLL